MITSEQMKRFRDVMQDAANASHQAIVTWGPDAQTMMAVEEGGELLAAIAQAERGRIRGVVVVDEAADVIITSMQVGMIHGRGETYSLDDLITSIANKTDRLRRTIAATRAQREVGHD